MNGFEFIVQRPFGITFAAVVLLLNLGLELLSASERALPRWLRAVTVLLTVLFLVVVITRFAWFV